MANPRRTRRADDAELLHRSTSPKRTRSNYASSAGSGSSPDPLGDDEHAQSPTSTAPPALSTSSGLIDEPRPRRTRTLMTPYQLEVLHALLTRTRFPTTAQREEAGKQIGLSARKVQVWFQNQRQKQNDLARRAALSAPVTASELSAGRTISLGPSSGPSRQQYSPHPVSLHEPGIQPPSPPYYSASASHAYSSSTGSEGHGYAHPRHERNVWLFPPENPMDPSRYSPDESQYPYLPMDLMSTSITGAETRPMSPHPSSPTGSRIPRGSQSALGVTPEEWPFRVGPSGFSSEFSTSTSPTFTQRLGPQTEGIGSVRRSPPEQETQDLRLPPLHIEALRISSERRERPASLPGLHTSGRAIPPPFTLEPEPLWDPLQHRPLPLSASSFTSQSQPHSSQPYTTISPFSHDHPPSTSPITPPSASPSATSAFNPITLPFPGRGRSPHHRRIGSDPVHSSLSLPSTSGHIGGPHGLIIRELDTPSRRGSSVPRSHPSPGQSTRGAPRGVLPGSGDESSEPYGRRSSRRRDSRREYTQG